MKIKAMVSIILIGCLSFVGAGCQNKNKTKVESIASGYTRFDITESNGKTVDGFGTQFDTLIVEPQNNLTDEEWQQQIEVIKEMRLQNVRVRFFPEVYERENDNDDPNDFDFNSKNVDFNSIEMNYYYKLFDIFEKNNVKVDLSWYGCRTTFISADGLIKGSWLGGVYGQNGVDVWSVVPSLGNNPEEEFAESVAACLYYLITTKHYTCISEYSIFPEPDSMVSDMSQFKRITDSISNRLKQYNIFDKLCFSGPADYNNNPLLFEEKYLKSMSFQKATSSVYKFDSNSSNEEMLEFAKGYSAIADKYNLSWTIAESGTKNGITPVTNADSETYDRGLFMARFMINMINGGCSGIKYFVFSDCYYDGALNKLGLFCYRHENWKAKPVYYTWSLISRYTEVGCQIFPVESNLEEVNVVAFKLADGSWSYMMSNYSNESKKIAIVNERDDRPAALKNYTVTGSSIPEDGNLKSIASIGEVSSEKGVAYVRLPSKGFVVLSNKVIK